MAQSPLTALTVYSSAYAGSATNVVDLGGLYRNIQTVTYTSSDAVFAASAFILIQKSEEENSSHGDGYPYQGTPYYEDVLANHEISTAGAIYDKPKQTFCRYIRSTLTIDSSNFPTGTVYVKIYFDGSQTP